MRACAYCSIIQQPNHQRMIYRNENIAILAPLKEDLLVPGHLLIVPTEHYESIYDIPAEALTYIMKTIKEISEILMETGFSDGINLLHASGESAQQTVKHFHFHLLPRRKEDGYNLWPYTGYAPTNYEALYYTIRKLMEGNLITHIPIVMTPSSFQTLMKERENYEEENEEEKKKEKEQSQKEDKKIFFTIKGENIHREFTLSQKEEQDLIDIIEELSEHSKIPIEEFSKIKIGTFEFGPEDYFTPLSYITDHFGRNFTILLREKKKDLGTRVDVDL